MKIGIGEINYREPVAAKASCDLKGFGRNVLFKKDLLEKWRFDIRDTRQRVRKLTHPGALQQNR